MNEKTPQSMTAADLLAVTDVERLSLNPDDMLVLKSPVILSDDDYAEISNRLRALLPDTKIIILEAGLDISVLRARE